MSRRKSSAAAFSLFSFQDIITSVTGIMILVTLIMALDLMENAIQSPPVATTEAIEKSQMTIAEMQEQVEALNTRLKSGVASLASLPSFDFSTLNRKLQETESQEERVDSDTASKRADLEKKQQVLQAAESAEIKDKDNEQQTLEDLNERVDDLTIKLESIESQDRMFFRLGITGKDCWVVEIQNGSIRVGKIGVSMPPRVFSNHGAFRAWLISLNRSKEALYLVIKPGGEDLFKRVSKAATQAGFDFGFTVEPTERQILDPKIGAGTP